MLNAFRSSGMFPIHGLAPDHAKHVETITVRRASHSVKVRFDHLTADRCAPRHFDSERGEPELAVVTGIDSLGNRRSDAANTTSIRALVCREHETENVDHISLVRDFPNPQLGPRPCETHRSLHSATGYVLSKGAV